MCLVLLLWGCVMATKGQGQCLVIWHADGHKTYYELAELPKTTFTKHDIVITAGDVSVTYPRREVLRYTYETDVTGIVSVTHSGIVRVGQQGDDLMFQNLPAGSQIRMFAADGKHVATITADGGSAVRVSLSAYPSGVYIVKANDATYKVIRR